MKRSEKKASSTQRTSQAVPQLSTDRALQRLTSEFERDPVCSLRYGRWRHIVAISLPERSLTFDLRDLDSESFSLGHFLAPARSRAEKRVKKAVKKGRRDRISLMGYLEPKWLR